MCCIKKEKFEIYHVRAFSNGGTNETNNSQPLYKACHLVKTSDESEQGQFFKINDYESTFNENVQVIIDSSLCKTHAFVEKAYFTQVEEDKTIYSIDLRHLERMLYIMMIMIIVYLLSLIMSRNSKEIKLDPVYTMLNTHLYAFTL
jgi:hypothetical protein